MSSLVFGEKCLAILQKTYMPAAACAASNREHFVSRLQKNGTNTFGKIKQRRDPVRGCLIRGSISEFKKIYAGEKKMA